MNNYFVGVNDQEKIIISSRQEGETFEQIVWVPLQHFFDYDIIRKPQFMHTRGMREMTDILAFSEY